MIDELPKLWYWFTWTRDGSTTGMIETFEDKIEALAKHIERSKVADILTPVHELFGKEIQCRDEGLRFWARNGRFGRAKRITE